jgi:hypothetical protein
MRYEKDMTTFRLATAVFLVKMVANSISAALGNYVLNGDFSRGRDHWDGDRVVTSDPDNQICSSVGPGLASLEEQTRECPDWRAIFG